MIAPILDASDTAGGTLMLHKRSVRDGNLSRHESHLANGTYYDAVGGTPVHREKSGQDVNFTAV